MASDILPLTSPPRKAMAVGDGALMIELEDRVCTLRRTGSFLETICLPEQKGERLVAPAGPKSCVMLATRGILKVYENLKVLRTRSGTMLDDDEPVDSLNAGSGSFVVLAGRMAGDDLLPTAEYRFVWVSAALEPLGRSHPIRKRRPAGWGIHLPARRLLLLEQEPDGQKLRALNLENGQIDEVARPRDLDGKQITGFSAQPTTGDLALTLSDNKGSAVAILSRQAGRFTQLDVANPGETFDRPSWSPDGQKVLWRNTSARGASLKLRTVATPPTREVRRPGEGDDWLWLDNDLLAMVKWDAVERITINPFESN